MGVLFMPHLRGSAPLWYNARRKTGEREAMHIDQTLYTGRPQDRRIPKEERCYEERI